MLQHFLMYFDRNGRWRSQWSVTFPESGGKCELTGVLKVQVCTQIVYLNILLK